MQRERLPLRTRHRVARLGRCRRIRRAANQRTGVLQFNRIIRLGKRVMRRELEQRVVRNAGVVAGVPVSSGAWLPTSTVLASLEAEAGSGRLVASRRPLRTTAHVEAARPCRALALVD